MSWECHAGVAEDCVGGDHFDPLYRDADGRPTCLRCARKLGLTS